MPNSSFKPRTEDLLAQDREKLIETIKVLLDEREWLIRKIKLLEGNQKYKTEFGDRYSNQRIRKLRRQKNDIS